MRQNGEVMNVNEGYRSRLIHTAVVSLEVIAGVAVYLLVYSVVGKGIPCLFRAVTGLQCPGCGMTRALTALVHGNPAEAMDYNALSLTLIPLIGIFLLIRAVKYIKTGKEGFSLPDIFFLLICLIVCIWFFLSRNNLI